MKIDIGKPKKQKSLEVLANDQTHNATNRLFSINIEMLQVELVKTFFIICKFKRKGTKFKYNAFSRVNTLKTKLKGKNLAYFNKLKD